MWLVRVLRPAVDHRPADRRRLDREGRLRGYQRRSGRPPDPVAAVRRATRPICQRSLHLSKCRLLSRRGAGVRAAARRGRHRSGHRRLPDPHRHEAARASAISRSNGRVRPLCSPATRRHRPRPGQRCGRSCPHRASRGSGATRAIRRDSSRRSRRARRRSPASVARLSWAVRSDHSREKLDCLMQ